MNYKNYMLVIYRNIYFFKKKNDVNINVVE